MEKNAKRYQQGRHTILPATESALPALKALASVPRMHIIEQLGKGPKNVKELAETLHLSSAIVVQHLNKLEEGGIIRSEKTSWNGLVQRRCSLLMERLDIVLPHVSEAQEHCHHVSIPIGQFTDSLIEPTCGLATADHVIGCFDDPRCFLDPERVNAGILWFGKGHVTYRIPNYLPRNRSPVALEISMEIGSEAPGVNQDWPSDIHFHFNGKSLGYWTCPGDFADRRGRLTPPWWSSGVGQYGMLKIIRITNDGGWIDGTPLPVTLSDLDIRRKEWEFRISVPDDAKHVGGATLYGKTFGNHFSDLEFKLYDV